MGRLQRFRHCQALGSLDFRCVWDDEATARGVAGKMASTEVVVIYHYTSRLSAQAAGPVGTKVSAARKVGSAALGTNSAARRHIEKQDRSKLEVFCHALKVRF